MTEKPNPTIPVFPREVYWCEDKCLDREAHYPENLWTLVNPPEGWNASRWYCDRCISSARFKNPDSRAGESLAHYLGLERDGLKALNAELFEALSDLAHWAVITDDDAPVGLFTKARRAIAKAEGRD